MQTSSAVVLVLKLLTSQPAPHWPLVVQALLLKDYALSIMLLSQPDVAVEAPRRRAHPTVVEAGKCEIHGSGGEGKFVFTFGIYSTST